MLNIQDVRENARNVLKQVKQLKDELDRNYLNEGSLSMAEFNAQMVIDSLSQAIAPVSTPPVSPDPPISNEER